MSLVRPWRVLSEQVVVERRWLRLREQRVELPNGHEIDEFHLLEGPDWAGVLALTEQNDVVMVRQYRHGLGRGSLELPAGVIEPDESDLFAAQRELLEETGYASDDWHALSVVSTEPARSSVHAHFFVARGARRIGDSTPEQTELLQIELWPGKSFGKLIDTGEICHGVQIGAILLAARRGFIELG
ncbi:MAG TPA: NUDIX hydrolase [Polyangiaceae bacterium]|jgi:ADP-ribose pyrophosphatase YjhB (NUDIX family)|nr:NUDIX hydrolase [Polyangiaceae bacterium]